MLSTIALIAYLLVGFFFVRFFLRRFRKMMPCLIRIFQDKIMVRTVIAISIITLFLLWPLFMIIHVIAGLSDLRRMIDSLLQDNK